MHSKLFSIIPNMSIDLNKLNKNEIEKYWCCDWDDKNELISIEIFKKILNDSKVYGYLEYRYSKMIENLFRNIMTQNPEIKKMEWHFNNAKFPYCLCIKRQEMNLEYCVKLILGKKESVYHEISNDGTLILNKEKYLKNFPRFMKKDRFLLKKNSQHEYFRKIVNNKPLSLLGYLYPKKYKPQLMT